MRTYVAHGTTIHVGDTFDGAARLYPDGLMHLDLHRGGNGHADGAIGSVTLHGTQPQVVQYLERALDAARAAAPVQVPA